MGANSAIVFRDLCWKSLWPCLSPPSALALPVPQVSRPWEMSVKEAIRVLSSSSAQQWRKQLRPLTHHQRYGRLQLLTGNFPWLKF